MLGRNEGGKLAADRLNYRFIDLSFVDQLTLISRFSEIKSYLSQFLLHSV